MAALRTTLVGKRHAWTGDDLPWSIDVEDESVAGLSPRHRAGWKLFHYLSGGGMRAFAASAAREIAARRQTRFLWCVSVLSVLWLIFRYV